MKKLIFTISILALLMGCHKGFDPEEEKNNQNKTSFSITATIAESKVSYAADGTNLKPGGWQVGDVLIGFDSEGGTYGFQVKSVTEGRASLEIIKKGDNKGSITETPENGTKMYMFYAPGKKPSDINSKSLSVSIANQSKDVVPALMMASGIVSDGSLSLTFVNKTAIIGIKNPTMAAAGTSYTCIALSGTGINTEVVFDLNGSGDLQVTYQTPGKITKAVEFSSNESKKATGVTYIVACPLTISTALTFTTNYLEQFTKTGKTMAAGHYYYMTPTFIGEHTNGALSGVFSVSATKQVCFSKGNLKATTTDEWATVTWDFEANQYDFRHYTEKSGDIAIINGISTTTPIGTAGSFWWINNTEATVHPYDGSYTASSKTDSDILFTNETAETPKSSLVVNGSTGVWRTLSGGDAGEWEWLLGPSSPSPGTNCRNSSTVNGKENARYMRCTIQLGETTSVTGILIFPDSFTWPTVSGSPEESTAAKAKINAKGGTFDITYSTEEFNILEAAGCVFLPVAGYRQSNTIRLVNGFYWASNTSFINSAYRIHFPHGNNPDPAVANSKGDRTSYAFPIRLVVEQ